MPEFQIDPFVSLEPDVEIDEETKQVLRQRVEAADKEQLLSAAEARKRIQQWVSNSSILKKL